MLRLTSHVLDRQPNLRIGKKLFDIVVIDNNLALNYDIQLPTANGTKEVLRYRCSQDTIPSLLSGKCEDA